MLKKDKVLKEEKLSKKGKQLKVEKQSKKEKQLKVEKQSKKEKQFRKEKQPKGKNNSKEGKLTKEEKRSLKEKQPKGKKQTKAGGQKIADGQVARILDILRQRKEYVTTVESMTAGMISARLADIPGSSDVLRRAFITYSDEAKHEMVGVRRKTLEKRTAVSRQVAKQMAKGGAKKAGAAACVSVTGYAGPPGDPKDDTVGLTYIGCFYHGKTQVEEHHYQGTRNEVRAMAMNDALRLLLKMLS